MTLAIDPGPRTAVWPQLQADAARLAATAVTELFAADPNRSERFTRSSTGLLMDFSRQRIDQSVLDKLVTLADAVGLRTRIDAMWRGDHINTTEDRAVLHVALRQPPGQQSAGLQSKRPCSPSAPACWPLPRACARGRSRAVPGRPFAW